MASPSPTTHTKPRIVVCGLARDCKKNLVRNWQDMQTVITYSNNCEWVVVENDSVDGTKEWLQEMAKQNPKLHVIGEPTGEASIPRKTGSEVRPWFSQARISKMAFFRNQYMEFVENQIGFDKVDFLIVIDFDVRKLPIDRICHWLDHMDRSAVITSFGIYWKTLWSRGFYDAYAYTELDDVMPQTEVFVEDRRKNLYAKYIREQSPLKILSNFSGCAIYPARYLHGLRYEALPNDDPHVESLCEHTSIHRTIHQRGSSVLIDPLMKVHYSTVLLDWKRYLVDCIKIAYWRLR
ncbi:MAG: hypothetical protein H8M99_13380 [Gloeobacteraceae cyanobacterium ES-bin-144]|nr:hypothetical protein [Verrucomicrobiales bacterium]